MGLGGISPWSLLLILAIVLILFGTKRLKGLGGDLGSAIKGFKSAMNDDEAKKLEQEKTQAAESSEEPLKQEDNTQAK